MIFHQKDICKCICYLHLHSIQAALINFYSWYHTKSYLYCLYSKKNIALNFHHIITSPMKKYLEVQPWILNYFLKPIKSKKKINVIQQLFGA